MMDILINLQEFFSYAFIQRAFIVGCLMALGCSILGVFLVLRRFAMISDGLAHVSFATVALALLLKAHPLFVSIPLVALTSLGILTLNQKTRVYTDALIGLVSSLGIAIGVIIASKANGFNVDLLSYLFGNILSVSPVEITLTLVFVVLIVIMTVLWYHDLFAMSFDEDYAQVLGVRVSLVNKIFIVLTSAMIVLGIKIVGTMLISSMTILPAMSALQFIKSFRKTMFIAGVLSIFSVFTGILLSYFLDWPSGATIVLVNFFIFLISFLVGKIK